MQAFEMQADTKRQILRTYFRGFVTADALQAAADRNAALVAQMKSGFTVITDLSELEEMNLDCVAHITRLMDLFFRAGAGRVVRVIPDPSKDIGFTLLSYTHYRGKIPFVTVRSRAECECSSGAEAAQRA